MMPKFQSAYSGKRKCTYPPAGMPEEKLESRTQQHFGNETNINTIVAKARKGNPLPVRNAEPLYGNFENGVDFLAQMNRVAQVTSQFEMMPSAIRNRFANNPAVMLDFIADPENVEESIELGLLPAEMLPKAPAVAPEPPPAPEPAPAPAPTPKPSAGEKTE